MARERDDRCGAVVKPGAVGLTWAEQFCGRPDVPPLAPSWTHERWTGHAFVSRNPEVGPSPTTADEAR